ncbi:peptidoglycan editing factor PgeF [Bryobacter aggregatus]|uniref:peptidoglycan editing factor PgeF n=1 Tax=Bryobacter aggregatus TaxID=360054 RepID=UPI000689277B|nr:peptidoglycan editing factor PgeF [Bryobacter aggregatus]
MIHAPHFKELFAIEHGFGTRDEESWLPSAGHAWAKQIHSDRVIRATTEGLQGEADAVVTTVPELWVSIRTADCLPILLADPGAGVVAAVHAGWRGTAAKIVAKTVEKMVELGAELTTIHAAIGPGIGLCCFEVGPEVSSEFGVTGRSCIDLAGVNERQLQLAGLELENIWISAQCTKCNPELFHSYRAEPGTAGRMVSAIRLV